MRTKTASQWGALAARVLGHTLGVSVLAGAGLLLIGGGDALQTVWSSPMREQLAPGIMPMLALHVVLSALVWGALVAFASRRNRAPRHVRAMRPARGTILLEFLIILGPFMLLTSGMIQLSVNNITHILSHVAAYEAGRAVWVWEAESGANPERKARLAAASTLAPTAPSGLLSLPTGGDAELDNLRGSMVAQFTPGAHLIPNPGNIGKTYARVLMVGGYTGKADSVSMGLDGERGHGFAKRAARKLTNAYGMTKIEVIRNNNEVGARLKYWHFNAMPWFGYLFGKRSYLISDLDTRIRGAGGYHTLYQREFTLPKQVPLS